MTPPTGAAKAAATPQAAPTLTKSRSTGAARKLRSDGNQSPSARGSMEATAAPEWIMGPSLPTSRLPHTAHTT
eukprot:CAMPEP_0206001708 /NCGR_PEP_ID=MMETSP1464-20131121/2285_1 /ASSEMBLY_ACC=CAM_ASM_001124 /TAXON_ID=119497 /ORGANISM="Exanthemachrysis gayraliae, Strain RCC1523" /LENGTH=72 /DNA_ID=CAMNT_0053375029 /DNA_START=38 /DNA_END=252 /DNA_ORIENTATION=+